MWYLLVMQRHFEFHDDQEDWVTRSELDRILCVRVHWSPQLIASFDASERALHRHGITRALAPTSGFMSVKVVLMRRQSEHADARERPWRSWERELHPDGRFTEPLTSDHANYWS